MQPGKLGIKLMWNMNILIITYRGKVKVCNEKKMFPQEKFTRIETVARKLFLRFAKWKQ